MKNASSFLGETCLIHFGSLSHSTPCALWEWIGPGTQGRPGGLGKGVGGGRGSSASLPGSGLTQVYSSP